MEDQRVRVKGGVYEGQVGTVKKEDEDDPEYVWVELDHEGFESHNPLPIPKEDLTEL